MKHLIGAGIATLLWVGAAHATPELTLRQDASARQCHFSSAKVALVSAQAGQWTGAFSVHCAEQARSYRVKNALSSTAHIEDFLLNSYLRAGGPACESGQPHPEAVRLHAGTRSHLNIGQGAKTDWSYCVLTDAALSQVQGSIDVYIEDAVWGRLHAPDSVRRSVLFDHNSHALGEDMITALENQMMHLGDPSQWQVFLHAHASLVGDPDYNHDLSIMRLKHVREWLITHGGIAPKDTWGQAWGASRLHALNSAEDPAQLNRRVEIVWVPKKTPSEEGR
jgi:outer membrane protein OmpA-like peptidoglycan-associated protein